MQEIHLIFFYTFEVLGIKKYWFNLFKLPTSAGLLTDSNFQSISRLKCLEFHN